MTYFKFLPTITPILVILFILYLTYLVLKPFLFVIIISLIFSIFLNPLFEYILKLTNKKILSAFLTILLLFLCILVPVVLVITLMIQEARSLLVMIQQNPNILEDVRLSLTKQLKFFGIPIQVSEFNLQNEVLSILRAIIKNLGSGIIFAGSFVLNTLFVLIITFFFLVEKNRLNNYLLRLNIIPSHYYHQIKERVTQIVNGIVKGNLIIVFIQFIIATIGFFIFGLPTPILLGMLYALMSLIPSIGVLLVWIPFAIIMFFNQGIIASILFAAWFVLSNLALDNLIAPRIIGRHTNLHQLLIMFAVIGGVAQFGIVGIVLGPVIIALALVSIGMYNELVNETKNQK